MNFRLTLPLSVLCSLLLVKLGDAIQCYQCDSNEDKSCPADWPFDLRLNAMVDCSSFEAKVPGTFCMKITQQSPGWGGWTKITRRCGSRSETGVAWGCRWEWEEGNGVWKENCYCEDRDGCNASTHLTPAYVTAIVLPVVAYLYTRL